MDKLLAIPGGQPLRADDWAEIQNIYSEGFRTLVSGLSSGAAVIVSGIQVSIADSVISIAEGMFFDGTELSSVPAASFTVDVLKSLYLVQVVETSDIRVFHDGVSHNVYESRRYLIQYETLVPSGVYFSLNSLTSLLSKVQLRTQDMINLESYLRSAGTIQFPSWATAATASQIQINKNMTGQVQIIAAFSARATYGQLFVLPTGYRPPSDIVLPFFNGPTMSGMCLVNSGGGVWLQYVNTAGVNYINLIFNVLYEDNVHYDVPTSYWSVEM